MTYDERWGRPDGTEAPDHPRAGAERPDEEVSHEHHALGALVEGGEDLPYLCIVCGALRPLAQMRPHARTGMVCRAAHEPCDHCHEPVAADRALREIVPAASITERMAGEMDHLAYCSAACQIDATQGEIEP